MAAAEIAFPARPGVARAARPLVVRHRVCGRYSTGARPEEIAERLGAELAPSAAGAPARFNVAPSQRAPLLVATPARRLGLARFGWTMPRKKGLLVNARVEGLRTNALFRAAAARHRALVPADGFYEWLREGGAKRAYFVRSANGELLTFAAIFDAGHEGPGDATDAEPEDGAGARAPSFLVVTRPAEGVVASVHDRMPLIVPAPLRDLWLSRAPLDEALAALRDEHAHLCASEVSSRVGSPAIDEPWLRDAIGPAPGAPA